MKSGCGEKCTTRGVRVGGGERNADGWSCSCMTKKMQGHDKDKDKDKDKARPESTSGGRPPRPKSAARGANQPTDQRQQGVGSARSERGRGTLFPLTLDSCLKSGLPTIWLGNILSVYRTVVFGPFLSILF